MITWVWKPFSEMNGAEVYALLALRSRVFVVEQKCIYQDPDGRDVGAWHLLGYRDGALVACARWLLAGAKYAEASIGRVVTAPEVRGTGAGRRMMVEALARGAAQFGPGPVRISAQAHLQRLYGSVGFVTVSGEYLEDDIPHVEMLRE